MVLILIRNTIQNLINVHSEKVQQGRFKGFDSLRAIFSIVVVALHTNLFNLFSTEKLRLSPVADILDVNVGYLAVPVFLQISLFLFYVKREQLSQQYFIQKRLPKIISLYFFWSLSKLVFDVAFSSGFKSIESGFSSIEDFLCFVVGGGGTIFYFFFSLIFLTIVSEILISFLERIKKTLIKIKISYYLLFVSCILVFSFPIIDTAINHKEVLTSVINPLSFMPYIFTTAIVVQELNEGKLTQANQFINAKLAVLLILWLFLVIFEWIFFKNFPHYSRLFPHYSRLSLVFASWFLLYAALLSKRSMPTIVCFLSGCSLGIYGFHTFFVDHMRFLAPLSKVLPGLGTVTEFLVALVGSITLTVVSRKIRILRNFV